MSAFSNDFNKCDVHRLNEELSKIAAALAGLSDAANHIARKTKCESAMCRHEQVRTEIRNRRSRARYFSQELFADPAWDILLDLFEAELLSRQISVSSACAAASVPSSTAIRWLSSMVKRGLLVRRADPGDGRRTLVELAPDTSIAMHRYFTDMNNHAQA